MSVKKIMDVQLSDAEINELLINALREITGFSGEIGAESLLIDELGLDSLGFLDLFFTIQTSIQKEVTNEQMRELIAEELSMKMQDFSGMSAGEMDRILYPQLRVRNFFNLIKRQIDPGMNAFDIERQSSQVFQEEAIDRFLASSFEELKNQKMEEQFRDKKITDPKMQEVVRKAFEAITPDQIRGLLNDKTTMNRIVKTFLKQRLDLSTPEKMREKLLSKEGLKMDIESLMNAEGGLGEVFQNYLQSKQESIVTHLIQSSKTEILNQVFNEPSLMSPLVGKVTEQAGEQISSFTQTQLSGLKEDTLLAVFFLKQEEVLPILIEEDKEEIIARMMQEDEEGLAADAFQAQKEIQEPEDFIWQKNAELYPGWLVRYQEEFKTKIIKDPDFRQSRLRKSGSRAAELLAREEKTQSVDIIGVEKERILQKIQEDPESYKRLVLAQGESLVDQFLADSQQDLTKILDADSLATTLLKDQNIQNDLIRELIDSQMGPIFDTEIRRMSQGVNDADVLAFMEQAFFTSQFKEDKIKSFVAKSNMQGELVENFMRDNWERITKEETERLLNDTELRNKLASDYIRDNFDPVEAMQFSNPEKMKELTNRITKDYLEKNLDQIIARYTEKYMNEMMDALPVDEEIEIQGDMQIEFMKKYVDNIELSQENKDKSEAQEIADFIARYQISDPMLLMVLETNFNEIRSQFEFFEKVSYDLTKIQAYVTEHYSIETALYLYSKLTDKEYDEQLRQEFTRYFLENHLEELVEVVIRRQFSFTESPFEMDEAEKTKTADVLEKFILGRITDLAQSISESEIQEGLRDFVNSVPYNRSSTMDQLFTEFSSEERQKLIAILIERPLFEMELKTEFTKTVLASALESGQLQTWIELLIDVRSGVQNPKGMDVLQAQLSQFVIQKLREQINLVIEPEAENLEEKDVVKVYAAYLRQDFLKDLFRILEGKKASPVKPMTAEQIHKKLNAMLEDLAQKIHGPKLLNSLGIDLMELIQAKESEPERLTRMIVFWERNQDFVRDSLSYSLGSHLYPVFVQKTGYSFMLEIKQKYLLLMEKDYSISALKQMYMYFFALSGLGWSWKSEIGWVFHELIVEVLGKEEFKIDHNDEKYIKDLQVIFDREYKTILARYFGEGRDDQQLEDAIRRRQAVLAGKAEVYVYDIKQELSLRPSGTGFNSLLEEIPQEQYKEINTFFSNLKYQMKIEPESYMKMADSISDKFLHEAEQNMKEIENDLFQYGNQLILEKYDYTVADRLNEVFVKPEFRQSVIEEIRSGFVRKFMFRAFNQGLKSSFGQGKNDALDYKQILKNYSREEMAQAIQKEAKKIQADLA